MTTNAHDAARKLIALTQAKDLSGDEQAWLRSHLQDCSSCREYADAAGRTIRALRSQPLAADSTLVQATQMRVRARSRELRHQRERFWLVGLSCMLVGISAAITTPVFWRAFAWVGEWAGVSDWVWQAGFAFFWMTPALLVSALLLARGTHLTHHGER